MTPESEQEEAPQTRQALAQDVLEYEKMVQDSAASGQLLTAIEVARDGLARFGGGKKLQQQLALALAQTGALDAARKVLDDVLKSSAMDEETLCLLGRVYKEMWRHASVPAEAREAIEQACRHYGEAFAIKESYYPGINLAFTLAAAGERAKAEQSARKVAKQCRAELEKSGVSSGGWLGKLVGGGDQPLPPGTIDGWLAATLAEALTHLGETKEATKFYRYASNAFKGRWRDLASMRRQAREILRFNGQPQEWLDACFEFPAVVMFSGHMVDGAGRPTPRFTTAMEPKVRDEIRTYLQQVKAGFGYSSAACGGDLIFCECLLEMDAKVNLVLPCPVNAFKRQSVTIGGPEWERRFHDVLARANNILIANSTGHGSSHEDGANSLGLVYANRILTGLAALQAQALDLELKPIALWDGLPAEQRGGTGSVVSEWEKRSFTPYIIRLPASAVVPAVAPAAEAGAPAARTAETTLHQEIKTLVFAEVVNFRKIAEHQLPAFVLEFKAEIARLIATLPVPPVVAETSAGAMYFVFEGLTEASRLALDLRDMIGRKPWGDLGLPKDLTFRAAIHSGPMFAFPDPITQRPSCLGAHVTRAQHILPTVTPGQVYVSQEFAALAGAERMSGVTFEFLGRLPTTRMFEDAPLYRLDRGK